MKVRVWKVIKITVTDEIPTPRLDRFFGSVPGELRQVVEVEVKAILESEADIAAWESAVGKTLTVYEPDLVPGGPDD